MYLDMGTENQEYKVGCSSPLPRKAMVKIKATGNCLLKFPPPATSVWFFFSRSASMSSCLQNLSVAARSLIIMIF